MRHARRLVARLVAACGGGIDGPTYLPRGGADTHRHLSIRCGMNCCYRGLALLLCPEETRLRSLVGRLRLGE
eukprot:COSAG05_NODE_1207_length_5523_cov_32.104535_1_plen_72_part_00